jgi:hypothetical protein
MTAIEWLVEQFDLEMQDDFHLTKIEQAKEMEMQKQDEFAIGFAEWCGVPIVDANVKELLEMYKK